MSLVIKRFQAFHSISLLAIIFNFKKSLASGQYCSLKGKNMKAKIQLEKVISTTTVLKRTENTTVDANL